MLAVFAVAVAVGLDNFAAAIAIGLVGVDARTRLRVGVVFGVFESGMPIVGLVIGASTATALGHASRWLAAGLLIAVGGYALAAGVRSARPGVRGRQKASARESPSTGSPSARAPQAAGAPETAGSAEHVGSSGGVGSPGGLGSPADVGSPGGVGSPGDVGSPESVRSPEGVGSLDGGVGSAAAGGQSRAGGQLRAGVQSPEHARRGSSAGGLGRLLLAGLALSIDNLAVGFALGSYHTPVILGAVTIGAVSVALALVGLELGSRLGARVGERGDQLAGLLLVAIGIAIAAGALS